MSSLDTKTLEISQLAYTRGCILKVLHTDDTPIYWVENQVFIGKPFRKLEELATFLHLLPILTGDALTCEA